jgi:hypothetical protein
MLHKRWRTALRRRLAGAGAKPPAAAEVKSRCGERVGKGGPKSLSGKDQEDERKCTAEDVSKAEGRRQNRGESFPREQSGRNLLTAQVASGMKAAGAWFRLLCGTWEPVAPMPREKRKWRPHERESTEAGHRDGVTRRSEEGPVMGLERRGDSVWLYPWLRREVA